MSFGAYGGIAFEVLGAPDKLAFDDKSQFAKINVIGEKPVLQWINDELTEIELGIYLHQMWCDPAQAISDLQQQRLLHRAQPFVIGSDNRGNYVLTNLSEADVWRADDGTIIAAKLKLTLLEFPGTLPATAPATPTQSNTVGTTTAGPGASSLQTPVPPVPPGQGSFEAASLTDATRLEVFQP